VANTELLVEVLAHVELEPSAWKQSVWFEAPQVMVPAAKLPEQARAAQDFTLNNDVLESMVGLGPSCKTKACIAGWACLLSGAQQRWCGHVYTDDDDETAWLEMEGTTVEYQGTVHSASDLACELFEIPSQWMDDRDLFHGNNDKSDVYEIGAVLFNIDVDELYHLVDTRTTEIRRDRRELTKRLKAEKAAIS